jgi:hypothetical protein
MSVSPVKPKGSSGAGGVHLSKSGVASTALGTVVQCGRVVINLVGEDASLAVKKGASSDVKTWSRKVLLNEIRWLQRRMKRSSVRSLNTRGRAGANS